MPQSFRQQVDTTILDRAAALFARRGFAKTSVQDVADAVGLSKAGLLHHFASKDVLRGAVLAKADALKSQALDQVCDLQPGHERDRRAIEVLVDLALAHPGLVALLLAAATQDRDDVAAPDSEASGALVTDIFGVDVEDPDPERLVRTVGAAAAVAVLSLAAHDADVVSAWRPHIVATCLDALGHARPDPARPDRSRPDPARPDPSRIDQVEA